MPISWLRLFVFGLFRGVGVASNFPEISRKCDFIIRRCLLAVSYLIFFLYMGCIRLRAEIILIILIETSLFCNVHIWYALPFMHAYLSVIKGSVSRTYPVSCQEIV